MILNLLMNFKHININGWPSNLLQNISIKEKLEITEEIRKQIVCIFSYNNKFVYSDIKMENILYKCDINNKNKQRFMIGDLGSASPFFTN